MQAFRCAIFFILGSVALFSLLRSPRAFAQTSLDDVHIAPFERGPGPMAATRRSLPSGLTSPLIRTDVQLVLVPVSVTDFNERLVTGLSKQNFEIFDGKRRQEIRDFSSEDTPASIGIIVDVSGSMHDKIDRVRDAVNQFCEDANPQDEFFLITFSDEPRLVADFTFATEEIEKELLFAQPKGRTALLDAIYMGLHRMKHARYAKRALVIISDGGDNHSRHSEREIRSAAKESDVMIYSVGLFDRYVSTEEEALGPELLAEISQSTGGRAFALEKDRDLPVVARHIGAELRTQYVLAYRPQDTPNDGKWHKIKVTLRLPKKLSFLRARARTGYYAKKDN
jgi:Ca-activated chloride channel homolog